VLAGLPPLRTHYPIQLTTDLVMVPKIWIETRLSA
jgi:hypothetical protein